MSLQPPSGAPDLGEPGPDLLSDEAVLLELERRHAGRSSWLKHLIVLVVSLAIFYHVGLFRGGVRDVVIIIGILLVHEAGHFAGMKLFGYRDVKMFFIPAVGAAVSGRSYGVGGFKRSLVMLMGPLPGILVSLGLIPVVAATQDRLLHQIVLMALIINGFNLLPLMPLDGGRLLQEVIFSRNRYVEAGFRIIAGGLFVLGGIALGDWIIGVLGGITLLTVPNVLKIGAIAKECRHLTPPPPVPGEAETPGDAIPTPSAMEIIQGVRRHMPGLKAARHVAASVEQVWERICRKPPDVLASLGLLAIYGLGLLLPIVGLVVLVAVGPEKS